MAYTLFVIGICLYVTTVCNFTCVSGFDLLILHTNDVRSRIEQFNAFGSACSEQNAADGYCYGGVARRFTKINEIRSTVDNVILLDAGNQFLGTLWFRLFQGQASAVFMEQMQYDVMCLGNHEFDLGDKVLAGFIDNVTFPIVSANIEVTSASPLYEKFTKSKVLTIDGTKIGVIGYIIETTATISNPSNNVQFTDVFEAVRKEVNRLTKKGIHKIIALGHAGYSKDLLVAEIDGVDIVVGGHTDTFLYNGDPPSVEIPEGPYPTVVTQRSGKKALVVQDAAWGKYLGYLNVTFDSMGEVTSWSGNPIILDSSVPEDPEMKALVDTLGEEVKAQSKKVLGSTKVILKARWEADDTNERNLANLFLDSVIDYHLNFTHSNTTWAPAAIAISNSGGIRASIPAGDVTFGDISVALPFNNGYDLVKVLGSNLREQLEHSVQDFRPDQFAGKFLQFSGLRVVYNSRPVSRRVISVDVLCLECDVPRYLPLVDNQVYNIFLSGFILEGGDGFTFSPIERLRYDSLETDMLASYLQRHSPVYASLEGRSTFLDMSISPIVPFG